MKTLRSDLLSKPSALEILYFCLNYDWKIPIPRNLFLNLSEEDITLLKSAGLIVINEETLVLRVDEANRDDLLNELNQTLAPRSVELLSAMINKIIASLNAQRDDTKNFIESMKVIPHAEALLISIKQINEPNLLARFLFNLASYYSRNSELTKAKNFFEKAIAVHQEAKLDNKMLGDVLQTYGTNFIRLQDCYKAEDILKRALEIRQECYQPTVFESPKGYNPIHHTAISYGSAIAYNLKMPITERIEKSLPIVKSAVNAFEGEFTKNRSQYLAFQIAEGKAIIGYLYRLNKQFELAEKYFSEAKELYLDKTLFKDSHIDIARLFNNYGLMALEKDNDTNKAKQYFLEGLERVKDLPPNNHHLCDTHLQLAKIYCTEKQYQTAQNHIDKGKQLVYSIYGEAHLLAEEFKRLEERNQLNNSSNAMRKSQLGLLSSPSTSQSTNEQFEYEKIGIRK